MLRKLKIINILLLISIAIYIRVLVYILSRSSFMLLLVTDKQSLVILEVILGLFAILAMMIGLNFPLIVKWSKRTNRNEGEVFIVHILRVALFETIAVYGLVLGLMGSPWHIWMPFFMLSGLALLLTFPTKRRLDLWQGIKLNL